MTSPLEQFSPSSPRLVTGTPLSQQLLKVILPTTLLPLIFAGAINWKLTDQRSMHEVQERTWNQSMLAADVSNSVAGTTGLTGKEGELGMVVEHAALTPSTQIRIIDLSSLKVLASLTDHGVEPKAKVKDEADFQSKLLALGKELKETTPPANKLPQPGKQPTYVTQQQNLENLVIQPFVHEEGIYALATSFKSGNYFYSVATVPNRNWVAVTTVALSEIEAAGLDAVKLYLALTIGLAIAASGITLLTARKLTQPLVNITETVKTAATGDLNVQVQAQGSSEVQVLAQSFNTLINQVRDFLWQQSAETQRSQMLRDLSLQLSQCTTDKVIQQTTVEAVRQILKTDRVLIFQFEPDWSGTAVAESVGSGWGSAQGMHLKDPCFANGYASQYQQGRISITPDIYTADLTDCYLQQLSTLSVRASLIAPVLVGAQLNALLIAHECEGARNWVTADVELFTQVATQLGLNLERISLLTRMQAIAQEQVAQREALQMGLLELLSRVESAAQGDLTVRAEVEGEVGTVGDFFNAIIGSLQTIVAQVKVSAEQVTESVHENEVAIRQLASDAKQQAQELGVTLQSIDRMTESIHTVAANAQEAAEVARSASSVAEVSSSTMDRAVSTIVNLRNTVAETSVKVQRLGEASKQISKVVELINQFALETNMLAINTGIEPARAGEEGRGFAVVAQEVGTLAAQSANATKEIEQIVASIQRETGALVQAMQSGKTQVEEGTQLIEDTKQGLNQIFGVSQQIDHLVQAISTATVEQVETSQTVAVLMQQLAQVSERTSESSQSVSNALQQTVAVTQRLQASVRTFKVADEG